MNEYLPPDGMTLAAAAEALAHHLTIQDGRVRTSQRTFYDTFDGLVHRAGLSLVHADETWQLVERPTGAPRARLAGATAAQRVFVYELAPSPLRDALAPIVDVRALLPVARVRTRERALDVLDEQRKTVVRMALEEPTLVKPRRAALRTRLRVTAVRGYDEELGRLRDVLTAELLFRAAEEPLVDEAIRAGGGSPAGTSSKIDVPLEYGEGAGAAAATVLRALLAVIEANYPGTIDDVDSEFLHDLRVAVRRTRAVQRELREVFDPQELVRYRDEFRWLQQVTGDARDLDVYVLEFDRFRALVPSEMFRDLDPVLDVLRERRLAARASMVKALRSRRARRLLRDWESFLDSLDDQRPIGALAGARIRKVYGRMVRMGDAIDEDSPPQDYHELRKKGKELRYLLELFGVPLYALEVVAPMVKALKGLQDVLGRHQDREVQVAMLQGLRDEVVARPDGAAALMAMGALVARLEADERAARAAFAQRFAEFASKAQRRRVKETFA
jgi:CHAD domain-containing protein